MQAVFRFCVGVACIWSYASTDFSLVNEFAWEIPLRLGYISVHEELQIFYLREQEERRRRKGEKER
jgi:hypothetical protein